jgi:hypothetical protein
MAPSTRPNRTRAHARIPEMVRVIGLLIVAAVVLPGATLAESAEGTATQPHWWEVIAGILAIPAAFFGLGYSYLLIRKTQLEARKTELEIVEKEQALKSLTRAHTEAAKELVRPLIEGRQAQLLILRAALLYVLLQFWGLIDSALVFIFGGVFIGAQKVLEFDLDNPWILFPAYVLSKLPQAVSWIIVIGIGWPLLRDLNMYLKINLKSILLPWTK